MAARIESGILRQLAEQFALAPGEHRGIHDLHDRVEIAFPAARLRQPLLPEPELAARGRPRWNLEVHAPAQRGNLDRRAERGLPGSERQVEIEVVPAGAEERVRMQRDVE